MSKPQFALVVKNDKTHRASLKPDVRRKEVDALLKQLSSCANADDKKKIRRALRSRDYYISKEGREHGIITKKKSPKVKADATNESSPAIVATASDADAIVA